MCGIVGFTHSRGPLHDGLIERATRTLEHRGPDQQGTYESPVISLGAVRLKIIDLDAGDQPMFSDDRDTVIVFNGEIYNHAQLRRELQERGHRFHSLCDTEVVLHAYLEWGRDCLSRLRGMFALAIWKESEKRLFLARDRMGIKPLYFLRQGDELYFGSELKAIFAHPGVERRVNPIGLDHYLSLNHVPGPYTLVEGIEKLRPGRWLEWRDGYVETGAFWNLEFHPQAKWTLDSAKEELDSLLADSVREHLISDVPLGVWSSGGLDSSTILHYAAQAARGRLKTFSVSFQGRSFDESPYFRLVSERYGTDHHEFDLNPTVDLSAAIHDLAYHADEPTADEVFGGYVTYLADRLAS